MGFPRTSAETLVRRSGEHVELVDCQDASPRVIRGALLAGATNVVIINSSRSWSAGLARSLRHKEPDLRILILADASRLTGFLLYDFDKGLENAGEAELIAAITAAANDRSFLSDPPSA